MQIVVEDVAVNIDLPKRDVKLREVVEEVEQFLLSVDKIPVSLTINGDLLKPESLETRADEKMKGDEILSFGVITVFDFIADSLQGSQKANFQLLQNIGTFAEELHNTEKTVTPEALQEEFQHFFEFWLQMYRLFPVPIDLVEFGGKPFKELFEDFSKHLSDSVEAMRGGDWVLAADLLQYEVVPLVEIVHDTVPRLIEVLGEKSKECRLEAISPEEQEKAAQSQGQEG